MNYLRPIIIHALEENIDNLLALPRRSFTYEETSFFPKTARNKRQPLTDDIDDLLVELKGNDDWRCFVRVAISRNNRDIFRQQASLRLLLIALTPD